MGDQRAARLGSLGKRKGLRDRPRQRRSKRASMAKVIFPLTLELEKPRPRARVAVGRSNHLGSKGVSRLYKMARAVGGHLKDAANLSTIHTHTLYTRFLTKDSLVIDLGANVGQFSLAIAKIGATTYALEALPSTFDKIPDHPNIKKYNLAISHQDGPIRLFVSDNSETTSVHRPLAEIFGLRGEETCPGITFEHFLRAEGIKWIDLLKVDIEGSEEALFETTSDETLRNISQITIEFHDSIPGSIPGNTVRRIKARLTSLGFLCLPFSYIHPRMPNSDLLFIRTGATNIHPVDRMYFRQIKGILELEKARSSALAFARKAGLAALQKLGRAA